VEQSWLCLLPADARRVRVADPLLVTAMRSAGAELVESSPDVEIGDPGELHGDAGVAVVSIGSAGWERGPLPLRIAKRSASSARMRAEARRAGTALRRLGYAETDVTTWDLGHGFRMRGSDRFGHSRRSAVEHLPQCALVFGRREPRGESIVEGAVRDAGEALGARLRLDRMCARGGQTLAFTDKGLVRVSVGPGRALVRAQSAALRALRDGDPPDAVARRVPWQEAEGRSSLGVWAVERLIRGDEPNRMLRGRLLDDCLDFLVALHAVKVPSGRWDNSLASAAEVVARVCGPAEAAVVLDTGRALDEALADVPRGFGHGDFSLGNLLVQGDELVGVVDWDSAAPDRPALIDVIHLAFTSRHRPADMEWGPKLVSDLIPWARCGGDDLTNRYCREVGLDPDARLLELLTIAYWLDRCASQLRTHAERWYDREWIHLNIELVARAIGLRAARPEPPQLKLASG
jgi:aminoglycoside phosphotransferase (APT) family kinase protein